MSKPDDRDPELELNEDLTAEEVAEAAALARALDRGTVHGQAPPEDALEAAALLRLGTDPVLHPTRKQAIWEELGEHLEGRATAQRESSRGGLLRWLLVLAPAAGVAALVVYTSSGEQAERATMAGAAREIPGPSRDLLEAQARLLNEPSRADLDAFESQMGEYREQVYASLEARYR